VQLNLKHEVKIMIRCTQQQNIKCLKCGDVVADIVRIGAFYMCPACFAQEFETQIIEFEPDSRLGKIYYKWLKKYKEGNII